MPAAPVAAATAAVVLVTYNRRELLMATLRAWAAQGSRPAALYVVDSASTDGTAEALAACADVDGVPLRLIRRAQNGGGAAGFRDGLAAACRDGHARAVLSDDDACPAPDCLAHLLAVPATDDDIVGATAVREDDPSRLCWPLRDPFRDVRAALPAVQQVDAVPFLAVCVPCALARRIGLPDARYFLSGDDVEYSLRVRRHGGRVLQARDAVVVHPAPVARVVRVAGTTVLCVRMPPARQYYDLRNRLWNARRYLGVAGVLKALLGDLVRLAVAVRTRPGERAALLAAGLRGVRDGLWARAGARYTGEGVDVG